MSNVITFPLVELASAPVDPCYGLGHRMLTLEQVCEWLTTTERHIRGLVEDGTIPYRKVGRLLRFYEPDIDAWTRPSPRRDPAPVAQAAPSHAITRPRTAHHQRISLSSL